MINVPAIDMISQEINLVGTYNNLDELMTLTAQGRVALETRIYLLDAVNDAMDDLDHGRLHGRGIFVRIRSTGCSRRRFCRRKRLTSATRPSTMLAFVSAPSHLTPA